MLLWHKHFQIKLDIATVLQITGKYFQRLTILPSQLLINMWLCHRHQMQNPQLCIDNRLMNPHQFLRTQQIEKSTQQPHSERFVFTGNRFTLLQCETRIVRVDENVGKFVGFYDVAESLDVVLAMLETEEGRNGVVEHFPCGKCGDLVFDCGHPNLKITRKTFCIPQKHC